MHGGPADGHSLWYLLALRHIEALLCHQIGEKHKNRDLFVADMAVVEPLSEVYRRNTPLLLYAGVQADIVKQNEDLKRIMKKRFQNTIRIDTAIIPDTVASLEDVIRIVGVPAGLRFDRSYHEDNDTAIIIFVPDNIRLGMPFPRLSDEERVALLGKLESHYGKADKYDPGRLVYNVRIGATNFTTEFVGGKTEQGTKEEMRTLALQIGLD